MTLPTHPYWPLAPSSFTEYNVLAVAGAVYNADTMVIDITGPSKLVDTIRRTVIQVPGLQYPGVAVVDSGIGQVPGPDWPAKNKSLYLGLWKPPTGNGWIGETGNAQTNGFPPEAQLSLGAVTGERINGTTGGYAFDADGTSHYETLDFTYGTIGPGSGPNGTWFWPQYPDQIRTGLRERPTQLSFVYNYIFCRGIGIIWAAWGMLKDARNLDPAQCWQWQITAHG